MSLYTFSARRGPPACPTVIVVKQPSTVRSCRQLRLFVSSFFTFSLPVFIILDVLSNYYFIDQFQERIYFANTKTTTTITTIITTASTMFFRLIVSISLLLLVLSTGSNGNEKLRQMNGSIMENPTGDTYEALVQIELDVPLLEANKINQSRILTSRFFNQLKRRFPIGWNGFRLCLVVNYTVKATSKVQDPLICYLEIKTGSQIRDLLPCVEKRLKERAEGKSSIDMDDYAKKTRCEKKQGAPTIKVKTFGSQYGKIDDKSTELGHDALQSGIDIAIITNVFEANNERDMKLLVIPQIDIYSLISPENITLQGKHYRRAFHTLSRNSAKFNNITEDDIKWAVKDIFKEITKMLLLCNYTVADPDCYYDPKSESARRCAVGYERRGLTENENHSRYCVSGYGFKQDGDFSISCSASDCEATCRRYLKHYDCDCTTGQRRSTILSDAKGNRSKLLLKQCDGFGKDLFEACDTSKCKGAGGFVAMIVIGVVILVLLIILAIMAYCFCFRQGKPKKGRVLKKGGGPIAAGLADELSAPKEDLMVKSESSKKSNRESSEKKSNRGSSEKKSNRAESNKQPSPIQPEKKSSIKA